MANKVGTGLLRGGATGVVGLVFGTGLMLVAQAVAARTLGPAILGEFALGRSVLEVGAVIAGLGLQQGALLHLSRSPPAARLAWPRTLVGLVFATSVAAAAAVAVSAPWVTAWLGQEPGWERVLKLLLLAMPFSTLATLAAGFALGRSDVNAQRVISNVVRPAVFFASLILVVLFEMGLPGLVAAWVVGSAAAGLTGLAYIARHTSRGVGGERRIPKGLIRYSAASLTVGIIYMVVQQADRLLLGALADRTAVAIYVVAASLASILFMVQAAFLEILAPMASALHHAGRHSEVLQVFNRASRLSVALVCVPLFAALAFPQIVVVIFGPEFEAATPVLYVMLLGQMAILPFGAMGPLVQMTGGMGADLRISAVLLLTNLLLNAVLIPRFGPMGAAIAFAGSMLAVQVMRFVYMRIRLRRPLLETGTWQPWVVAAVAFGTAVLLAPPMAKGFAWAWVSAATSFGAYAVSFYAKGIEGEDRILLGQIVERALTWGRRLFGRGSP